jgi:hypothetical protein
VLYLIESLPTELNSKYARLDALDQERTTVRAPHLSAMCGSRAGDNSLRPEGGSETEDNESGTPGNESEGRPVVVLERIQANPEHADPDGRNQDHNPEQSGSNHFGIPSGQNASAGERLRVFVHAVFSDHRTRGHFVGGECLELSLTREI